MFQTQVMEINMGPQHPSTHGVLRLILKLDGERVVEADPDIGYLHRGVEKLSEAEQYPGIVPLTDRLDYIAAMSENLGYVQAVERLANIEVPERAQYIRVIMNELQRIASHLLWLGTHALDLGAMTVFFYCFREREMILDLFEQFCGARLTYNAFRIGGLPWDLPEGWEADCQHFLDIFPDRLVEYETLLSKNRIFLQRTKGVGYLSAEDAVAWGVTGPCLRASGVDLDWRKARPYAVYDRLDFDVPLGENCDTYDRYLLRLEEMRQSRRIVLQCLKDMPEGPIKSRVPARLKPPVGEVYEPIEGPRGEQGFYIVSDGTDKPHRMRFRAPSFVHLQALPVMIQDQMMADVIAVIGTIDIVLGDCDR